VGGNTTDQRTEGDPDPAPVLRDNRDLLVEKLKIQIARLKRMHFGRSSEKLATEIAQLELALEELEACASRITAAPHFNRRRAQGARSLATTPSSARGDHSPAGKRQLRLSGLRRRS
jgi:hypothetical protein